MIKVRFDEMAEAGLVLVVEPPPPRADATDNVDAAANLFEVLARKPDETVSLTQLR